jgi:YD repeat-containing protein
VTASFSHDNADHMQKIVDSRGESPSFRWVFGYGLDDLGQITSSTDREPGMRHSYGYDLLNRVNAVSDPLNRTTSHGYDGAGNLSPLLDPMNRMTSYGYDAAYHLQSITYSDGTTPNVSYSYSNDGLRTGVTDGTGTSSFRYDSLFRLSC